MKLKSLLIKMAFASTLALSAVSALAIVKANNPTPVHAYTNGDAATYYSGINSTATGTTLLSALQSLNSTKLQHRVGYSSMPSYFATTDPGDSSGQTRSFYSGSSATYSGNMNREHVWPASRTVLGRDKDPLEDDMHMVRPTLTSENSSRGNSFFAESGAWDPASFNNPSYRGDAARIIFYCVVADSQLSLVDKATDSTSNHTMGKLADMLQWNIDYPVQSREETRNEEVEKLQGNRNPFIDHPGYACKIWGNTNSDTQRICANDTSEGTTPTALTMNYSSKSVSYQTTVQLSVTPTPSDASANVTWSSNNENVATVDATGVVRAVGVGNATITATSIMDTSITATCYITVPTPSNVDVTSIIASVSESSIAVGNTSQITVANTPTNAYPIPTYQYSSSNTSVATVNSSGLVTGVSAGSVTITIRALQNGIQKCSTTVNLTVRPQSIVNTIEECYSKSNNTSINTNVYGLFVGSPDNASSVIMNGEYGILLYQTAPDSSWVENETYLVVSKSTLSIYNNLYELKNCTVSVLSNTNTILNNVEPISTYTISGNEGSTTDYTIASRICLTTGVVTAVQTRNGSSYNDGYTKNTDNRITMTVNGQTIYIFIKSGAAKEEVGTKFNAALSSGDEILVKGYTSFYQTFQIQFKEFVEASSTYLAEDFAQELLDLTETICTTSVNKESDLSPVWVNLEMNKYSILANDQKIILLNTNASNSGTVIQKAMARYDFIVSHYVSLNNFIGRTVNPVGIHNNFLLTSTESTTALIIIVAVVGLTGIGAVLFLKKRKEN